MTNFPEDLPWHKAVEQVTPHVVQIFTRSGRGTGFLLYYSTAKKLCAIATAAHVVDTAHYWEEPIRLTHQASGKTILLRVQNRAIVLNSSKDVAAVIFDPTSAGEFPVPQEPLPLVPKTSSVKVGVELGWVGFPAVAAQMCFFTGRISAYVPEESRYLVDGVAINGVSGGPSMLSMPETVFLAGVVSAYRPNRATGEALPGLAVVCDVDEFHAMIAAIESFAQAQAVQTPPSAVQGPPPEEPGPAPAVPEKK